MRSSNMRLAMKVRTKRILAVAGVGVYRNPRHSLIWTNPPATNKHQRIVPAATYAPWLSDNEFSTVYNGIRTQTMVDILRCYELWNFAKQAHKVEGDILEVGVWRGGSGALLAEAIKANPAKKVYLADTFSGVVKAGAHDPSYNGGEHSDTSSQSVESMLSRRGLTNCEVIVGMFPEDSGHSVTGKLALVHCDVDVYQSAKDVFEWCLPRLSQGAVVVFDDYGFSGCEGVALLCNEIAARSDFMFVHNLNGHAVLVKIC